MTPLDRRSLLLGATTALAAAGLAATTARAAAPLAGNQAPGYYRFTVGTLEVTVISDGTLGFPADGPWSDHASEVAGVLAAEFRGATPAVLQLNTIVVNTGDKLVLLDSGTGGKFQAPAARCSATSPPPATCRSRWTPWCSRTCTPTTSGASPTRATRRCDSPTRSS